MPMRREQLEADEDATRRGHVGRASDAKERVTVDAQSTSATDTRALWTHVLRSHLRLHDVALDDRRAGHRPWRIPRRRF